MTHAHRERASVWSAVSDAELMRRVQADDITAFEVLFDRYSSQASGLARLICRSSDRAEDAVQEGFIAAWRSRASYDPARGTTSAWLLTLVRHRSIDTIRVAGRHDRFAANETMNELAAPGSLATGAERREEGVRLMAGLRELPPPQREAIALAFYGGLSHIEIAQHLHLPLGTVKGRIRLGLRKLGRQMDPGGAVQSEVA